MLNCWVPTLPERFSRRRVGRSLLLIPSYYFVIPSRMQPRAARRRRVEDAPVFRVGMLRPPKGGPSYRGAKGGGF